MMDRHLSTFNSMPNVKKDQQIPLMPSKLITKLRCTFTKWCAEPVNRPSSSNQQTNQGVHRSEKILCFVCNEEKPSQSFSDTQLKKFTGNSYTNFNKTKKPNIRCKKCTTAPKNKLKCTDCLEFKLLDHFSKNQRRNAGDFIRCIDCMKKSQNESESEATEDSDYDFDI